MGKQENISITKTCKYFKVARSGYYKTTKNQSKTIKEYKEVVKKVLNIRRELPKVGTRKLQKIINDNSVITFEKIGRDKLFKILKSNDLLIVRKRKYAVTTNSLHPFKKYKNLIKDKVIKRVNQVWVSDITYIRSKNNFYYLSLITDVFSRRIMGWELHHNLETKGCLKALNMAYKNGKPEIHHSDRGSQYCSYKYTEQLKKYNVKISMTEDGNCYENAIAERINGILKEEFNLNATFENLKQAKKEVKEAVKNYNQKRPHFSLNLKMPNQVYFENFVA